MSLINAIEAIKSRVNNLNAVSKGVEESRNLQQRLTELQRVSIPLNDWCTKVTFFRAQGVEVPMPQQILERARKRVENVQRRFIESREASSLTEGTDWRYLKQYIGEANTGVDGALLAAWKSFIQRVFTGESTRDLERALAPTDANKTALVEYDRDWRSLAELAKCLPVSDDQFVRVTVIAERLREIHGRFERDVPEDVKVFLEAVGRDGAGLSLLTEAVRQWLTENESTDHYRIIAK